MPSPDSRLSGLDWVPADGGGTRHALSDGGGNHYATSFTADGKHLIYTQILPATSFDLFVLPVETDATGLRAGKPEVYLNSKANERDASFSPDGRWIAYFTDESGNYEVYVRSYPDKGRKWQISSNGGFVPVWSRSSKALFFRNEDGRIMVVPYSVQGDTFVPGKPCLWSDASVLFGNAGARARAISIWLPMASDSR